MKFVKLSTLLRSFDILINFFFMIASKIEKNMQQITLIPIYECILLGLNSKP